jgi:hypothetical protein
MSVQPIMEVAFGATFMYAMTVKIEVSGDFRHKNVFPLAQF